jgi:NitT/TauT family transport system substrate-binding protein
MLVALICALAAAWQLAKHRAPPVATVSLTIATNTSYVGACPVVAAYKQGFFSTHNLQVTIAPYSSGKQALKAVIDEQADMATVADVPVVLAALEGKPVRILATIFRTGQDHGVVARKDRGIVRASDLRGRRIGVSLATSAHFALEVLLNFQRLDINDVVLVNYEPAQLLPAIASGAVDAVAGWEPFLTEVRDSLGAGAVSFSGEDIYESVYNLVALDKYLRKNPAAATALLMALNEGEIYCRTHPQQLTFLLPHLSHTASTAAVKQWSAYHFGLELDQSLLLTLEDQARWAINNKYAPSASMPNFLDHIYLDAIRKVTPSDVSILY